MGAWSVLALVVSLAPMASACGRLGFDPLNQVTDGPAPADGPPAAIEWVKVFSASRPAGTGPTHEFLANAQRAGDAVVLLVACAGSVQPTSVSVTGTGWRFDPLGPITGTTREWAASFGAIAPHANSTLFSVSWVGSTCDGAQAELGDEFTNTDPTGGSVTFDVHAESTGFGIAMADIITGHANDAVWAASVSSGTLTDVGVGYTKGADNSTGDWSEHRITTAAAGADEPVMFRNANVNEYVLTAVTIKPR